MENNTLTFAARSGANPERVATFTLSGEDLHMDLSGAIVEGIEKNLSENDQEVESSVSSNLMRFARPLGTLLIQQGLNTFPISDATAYLKEDKFSVLIWTRLAGLRLAPIVMRWQNVDNPGAAAAFVEGLENRKRNLSSEAPSSGPGSYWGTWVFGGFIVAVLLKKVFYPGKTQRDKHD